MYLTFRAMRDAHPPLDAVRADKFFWMFRKIAVENGTGFLPSDMANRLEELRARDAIRKNIAKFAVEGTVYVHVWQRDCDMAEWTERRALDAHFEIVIDWINALYDNAEGPVHWYFFTKDEYDAFKRESRDRALEAFEDGHPHVIYA